MTGPLGSDCQPVKLAAQAHGEVADVDHLLHFAQALLQDLARLQRHQRAQIVLLLAQFLAKQTDQFAPARRRHLAPREKRLARARDHRFGLAWSVLVNARDLGAVDWGRHTQASRRHLSLGKAAGGKNGSMGHHLLGPPVTGGRGRLDAAWAAHAKD